MEKESEYNSMLLKMGIDIWNDGRWIIAQEHESKWLFDYGLKLDDWE